MGAKVLIFPHDIAYDEGKTAGEAQGGPGIRKERRRLKRFMTGFLLKKEVLYWPDQKNAGSAKKGQRLVRPSGRRSTLLQLPAKLPGGDPALLFEQAAEVQRILVTDDLGDLRDIVGGGFQQALGIGDPEGEEILRGRGTSIILEIPDKPADAHAAASGILLNVNQMIVMGVEIGDGQIHFINEKDRFASGGFFLKPADQDEEKFQVVDKNLLVMRFGKLQLLNHVQINLFII